MKIAIAQTCPLIGNIDANVEQHLKLIQWAAKSSAECIIFPELSITGYDPAQASKIALKPDHKIFDKFQKISDDFRIAIGFGAPINTAKGVCISMVLFKPYNEKQFYFKKFLHSDEKKFFVSGENLLDFSIDNIKIAFAICYEISVEEHIQNTLKYHPNIFIASVVKSNKEIQKAFKTLSRIAQDYKLPVLMANSAGFADGEQIAGLSSVWDENGNLQAQLSNQREGVLIFDTDSKKIEIKEY